MTADNVPERALDRRLLIRGGAVLAGAAGIAAAGAVVAPTAQAATGGSLVLGAANEATSTTTITENGKPATLSLVNTGGASQKLNPLAPSFAGDLAVGEIANTTEGPLIGVEVGNGVENTILVTGYDLAAQPAPIAFTPERLLDTRDADSRRTIIGSSTASPFDSSGQLKAEQWVDIEIAPVEVGAVSAVFLNLTSVKPATAGFLAAYPSGFPVPKTSNINFQPKVTVANAAFIAVGEVSGSYGIRIYVARASHVIVDLTGVVLGGESATPEVGQARTPRQAQQSRRVQRMRNAVARTARR